MTLEKTRVVMAPLAAKRMKLPAEGTMGHHAGTGFLPQCGCCGMAVVSKSQMSSVCAAGPCSLTPVRVWDTFYFLPLLAACSPGALLACVSESIVLPGGWGPVPLPLWAEKDWTRSKTAPSVALG